MENIDLVYSFFNQYMFQDAKNNIDLLEHYFETSPATMGNPLVGEFISSIRKYNLEAFDLPLFRSIMARIGKSAEEGEKIIKEIVKWKTFGKEQMIPARQFLRDVCASSLIQKANYLYPTSPSDFLKYLKQTDIKQDTSDVMSTSDFDKIDINTIIADGLGIGWASRYPQINDCFQPLGMYESGQMVMISMPPGCMSGDTVVMLGSDTVQTLSELYQSGSRDIPVKSHVDGEIRNVISDNVQISRYVDSWYVVEIEWTEFRVTPDHPFLMIDGTWKRADSLVLGDRLWTDPTHSDRPVPWVTRTPWVENLDTPQPVYDMVNAGPGHNYAVRLESGRPVFSHNTGKTLFMMGEALHMASNGAKCHYLAMGDMKPRDFIVRMGAIFSGLDFASTTQQLGPIYNSLCQAVQDRIGITVVPSAKVSAQEYIEYIKEKEYDVLFIDYDSNFLNKAEDNMYSEYGKIYDQLTELTQAGKLVFVAAQPKISAWNNEVIQLDMVGESSRKIHTVDVLITAGRLDSPNHMGIFKMCKNRRGEEGSEWPYIRLNNGRFKLIPKGVYSQLGQITEKTIYQESEIDQMVQNYFAQMAAIPGQLGGNSGSVVSSAPGRMKNPF